MPPEDTLLEEYFKATEPYQEPENIQHIFVRMANVLVGQQQVGDKYRELTVNDIKGSAVFDNIGFLQDNGESYTLGLNYRWWDEADPEGQYAMLLHEVTHLQQTGHGPPFWDTMAKLHTRAKEQYALIEQMFSTSFDWKDAEWYVVTMADIPNVEFEIECVPERRQKMADKLGINDFDPFELTADRLSILEYEDTERIPLSSVAYTVPSDHTLYEQLRQWLTQPRSAVTFDENTRTYQCEPPTVGAEASGTGNRPVLVGEDRVAFVGRTVGEYRDSPTVPVRIADDEPPQ